MKKFLVSLLVVALSVGLSGCLLVRGPSDTSKTITDISDSPEQSPSSQNESSEPEQTVAGVGQMVTGDKWSISLLYAKTFSEVKSEYFSDTPSDGKSFLVLFFEVENVSNEDDYFNYFNIESYVDGYNTPIKLLLNDPDGIDVLTGDVAAGKKLKGHLAWEVSPGWKELEVSYKDNLWTGGKAATFRVVPSDLTA